MIAGLDDILCEKGLLRGRLVVRLSRDCDTTGRVERSSFVGGEFVGKKEVEGDYNL